MVDVTGLNFAKVMNYPDKKDDLFVFDFSKGYDAASIQEKEWGIGRYNERRKDMYTSPLFNSERNIHMGIDIWGDAGEPVYSFWGGEVRYMNNNDNAGDYGPTIVIEYILNGSILYALYGHLSEESLNMVSVGESVQKGQPIAVLGDENVNGGWVPHLHFQLSVEDPGEADMPGVVAAKDREDALKRYPDPRMILGDLY